MRLPSFSSGKKHPVVRILADGAAPAASMDAGLPVEERIAVDGREVVQSTRMKGRIWLCLAVFFAAFAALSLRLVDVTLIGSPEHRMAKFISDQDPAAERPEITDRNGRRLAMNRQVIGAVVNTHDIWDAAETAEKLVTAFPEFTQDELKKKLESQAFVTLSNQLPEQQRQALLALGLPGVEFTESLTRVYPQGAFAAHVIGYTVPGRGGVAGLENVIDARQTREQSLVSSIDSRAQQILEQELYATLQEYAAKAAWGVVMDVHTGEVIALASLPDFNPNELAASDPATWRNRAMYDLYELGSAFKILTAAMAVEDGITSLDQQYDVRHPLDVGNKTISDYHPKGGFMTLSEILQHSSNIGISRIALNLGAARQRDYLAALGLTGHLATELPEVRTPMLPVHWGDVETATVSYGHGIAVTPLQLTAAIAASVNGGRYLTPTFVKVEPKDAQPGVRVFSEKTSATMRLLLRRVITDGTGRSAETPGYYAIGKTATADKPSPFGGYKQDERLSSFVGAFPGYDPEFVMLVSFDEPQPTPETYGYATAGVVAAPAFQRILARLAPVLEIQPVNDDYAFAQFMSAFREKEELQLAMAREGVIAPEPMEPSDQVAKLLSELGP